MQVFKSTHITTASCELQTLLFEHGNSSNNSRTTLKCQKYQSRFFLVSHVVCSILLILCSDSAATASAPAFLTLAPVLIYFTGLWEIKVVVPTVWEFLCVNWLGFCCCCCFWLGVFCVFVGFLLFLFGLYCFCLFVWVGFFLWFDLDWFGFVI